MARRGAFRQCARHDPPCHVRRPTALAQVLPRQRQDPRSAAAVQPERPHPLLLAGSGSGRSTRALARRLRDGHAAAGAAFPISARGPRRGTCRDDTHANDRSRHSPHPTRSLSLFAGLRAANYRRRHRNMKTYPDSATAVGACSLLLALQLAGTAAVRAADSAAADPTPAVNAQAANASSTSSSEELNEVIVTGIRADLEKALNTKEFAPVVLDSIDSTELGRFPDSDVADSLEHLPSITVSHTTGAEGQKITVQSTGSQYNIVTMDNRILASDDSGRDIAFDVLPAEL